MKISAIIFSLLLLAAPVSAKCYSCSHRSSQAKTEFKQETGFPHGRPGYVIDHVVPLACGGADSPSNMQWQTKAEGKAKDKWERKGCSQ